MSGRRRGRRAVLGEARAALSRTVWQREEQGPGTRLPLQCGATSPWPQPAHWCPGAAPAPPTDVNSHRDGKGSRAWQLLVWPRHTRAVTKTRLIGEEQQQKPFQEQCQWLWLETETSRRGSASGPRAPHAGCCVLRAAAPGCRPTSIVVLAAVVAGVVALAAPSTLGAVVALRRPLPETTRGLPTNHLLLQRAAVVSTAGPGDRHSSKHLVVESPGRKPKGRRKGLQCRRGARERRQRRSQCPRSRAAQAECGRHTSQTPRGPGLEEPDLTGPPHRPCQCAPGGVTVHPGWCPQSGPAWACRAPARLASQSRPGCDLLYRKAGI